MNRLLKHLCFVGLCLLFQACGNEAKFDSSANADSERNGNELITETFTGGMTSGYKPVDVAFVVDTSGSMDEEKTQLELYLSGFITALLGRKLDYQMFMIGTNFNFPDIVSINPKLMPVSHTVDSWNGLDVGLKYLRGEFNDRLSLRPKATQYLVFITDDNSSMKAVDFIAGAKSTGLSDIKVSGLVGLKKGTNNANCKVENVGENYKQVANNPEFAGIIEDVCTTDWSSLLEKLANSLLVQATVSEFVLEQVPVEGSRFAVDVDGEAVDPTHYSFDDKKNAIVFEKNHAPMTGSAVTIKYYVKK